MSGKIWPISAILGARNHPRPLLRYIWHVNQNIFIPFWFTPLYRYQRSCQTWPKISQLDFYPREKIVAHHCHPVLFHDHREVWNPLVRSSMVVLVPKPHLTWKNVRKRHPLPPIRPSISRNSLRWKPHPSNGKISEIVSFRPPKTTWRWRSLWSLTNHRITIWSNIETTVQFTRQNKIRNSVSNQRSFQSPSTHRRVAINVSMTRVKPLFSPILVKSVPCHNLVRFAPRINIPEKTHVIHSTRQIRVDLTPQRPLLRSDRARVTANLIQIHPRALHIIICEVSIRPEVEPVFCCRTQQHQRPLSTSSLLSHRPKISFRVIRCRVTNRRRCPVQVFCMRRQVPHCHLRRNPWMWKVREDIVWQGVKISTGYSFKRSFLWFSSWEMRNLV